MIERVKEEGDDDEDIAESAGNALEMAILGNAKRFIRSPSAQKVIGTCCARLDGRGKVHGPVWGGFTESQLILTLVWA